LLPYFTEPRSLVAPFRDLIFINLKIVIHLMVALHFLE